MENVVLTLFDSGSAYVSADARWKLEHESKGDSVDKKRNVLRIEIDQDSKTSVEYLNFATVWGDLPLRNYHGDPDAREFVEYTRR